MINILLASHSKKLADGLREILIQMAPDVKILASGGDKYGNIGSNFDEINELINKYAKDDGINLVRDGLIAYDYPDDEALEECRKAALDLSKALG